MALATFAPCLSTYNSIKNKGVTIDQFRQVGHFKLAVIELEGRLGESACIDSILLLVIEGSPSNC